MIVSKAFGSYNPRRYGKPWGTRITFQGVKPVYSFDGHWDGEAVLIEAEPCSVVAFGQKDMRKGYGENKWFIVSADGELHPCTEAQARKYLMQPQETSTTHA